MVNSLVAGAGEDVISVDYVTQVTTVIDGGNDNDILKLNIAGQTINLSAVTSIETINATGLGNTLQATDADNTWDITSTDAGTLNGAALSFTSFQNLKGGTGVDDFTLVDIAHITGLIDGGTGAGTDTDSVTITGNAAQNITLGTDIAHIETLIAQVGTNTLRADNTTNIWNITDTNIGSINDETTTLSFTNFSELVGGGLVDDFYFYSNGVVNSLDTGDGNDFINLEDITQVTGVIDGGGGTDTLNLSNTDQVVNISDDIIRIEALNGTGKNTLQATDGNNNWFVNNANQGKVGNINFDSFTDLQGGTDVDTFTITAAINSINAGSGADMINLDRIDRVATAIDGGADSDIDTVTLTDNNQIVNLINDIVRIEKLIGSAAGSNTLQATNAAINTWLVDGVNQGTINDGATEISFQNFTDLEGGSNTDNFTVTAIGSVDSIHAGDGTDSVLLATVSSVNDIAPSIAIDGGNGEDTLTVDTLNNTWAFVSKANGTVSDGGNSRKFANFEVQNSKVGSKDTLDYSGYNDHVEVNLNLSTTIGTVIGNLDPNFTSTIIGLNDTSNTWLISKVTASDGINDGSVTANGGSTVTFRDFDILTGGNEVDTFTITDTGSFDGTINGGGGTNTLTGSNTLNTWIIDNDNAGSLSYLTVTTNFNGIANVVGGSAVDNFTVSASLDSLNAGSGIDVINLDNISRVNSAIDGGDDDDTVNISTAGQTVNLATDIIHVENLIATGSNILQSGNSNNTWAVTSNNIGTFNDNVTLVNFTNFNELLGGSGIDNVTLSANIDSLNTGDGDDIINVDLLSRVTNAIDGGGDSDILNISLGGQVIELGNGFTGIETLNGTGSNILQGTNSNNTWRITSNNTGTVDDTVNLITFNNFSTLIGGNVSDDFILSDINLVTGLINGGEGTDSVTLTNANQTVVLGTDISGIENLNAAAGTNTLQAEDITNAWLITGNDQGSVAGTSFTNFSDLVGGSADDSFTLATINQISGVIDGGTGNNTVTLTTANQHIILETDIKQIDTLVTALGSNTLQAADVANTWSITGNNEGSVAGVSFSKITDLVGGSGVDSFTLSTIDQISGVIDGGAGSDSLTLTTANQTVNLSTDVTQVENINATTSTLVAHNEVNVWLIDASDGGTITNTHGVVSFKGFANLTGGSNVDSFTISGASGDISGLISGAGGRDSLVLSSIKDQVIELGSDVTDNLNVDLIESITANRDSTNTLLADNVDNVWLINGNETGSITYSGLTTMFSNFEHLIGGSAIDKFTVSAGGVSSIAMGAGNDSITSSGGNIALVNGNEGDDTFTLSGGSLETMQGDAGTDYVAYSEDNVSVTLGDTLVGFEGITALQGNGILNAQDDVTTTWTIDEENKGVVIDSSAGSSSLIFSGFASLNGGSGVDNFIVNDNGAITGIINGGASADTLTVNLNSSTRNQTGTINFNGGTGDDVITIAGSANKFSESFNPNIQVDGEQYDQLAFDKNNSTVNVDINYHNVATVNDNIETTSLVLNNSLTSDTLYLSNTSFGASSALVNVTFSSAKKGDITVAAADNSNLVITDSVTVNGDLTITASDVSQEAGTVIAQRLILDDVALVGRATDGIEVNVDELLVQNHSGEIYLNEQDDISLSSLSNTSGLVNISSDTGAITSRNILTSTGELDLTAATDINLLGQNQLSGELSLSAGNNIVVNNNTATNIAALTATNATINSAESLTVSGDINVVSTSSADNSIEGVLTISSTLGDINLNGHTVADSINITAENDINLASVNAKNLTATATNGNIIATGSVSVKQTTPGPSTLLTAENGAISFENSSNDFDGVSLLANSAVITDQNGLGLTNVLLTNSLIVNANGDVTVATITAGESIVIDAGNGAIVSQESNITAPQLTLRASTGIGSGNYDEIISSGINSGAMNTNTATLSAINSSSGMVNINNSQAVTIADLRNNGDIVLTNTGDITLQVSQVEGAADGVMNGAINANYGQDINNAVYSGQVAIFNSGVDSIYTTGLGFNEADIIAESLLINSISSFGTIVQPIRLRVNETFTLIGILASVNYFGAEPRIITTSKDLSLQVISTIAGLSGQQLVAVESLDDVDPAIFADVRNYNVDDTSVLLPKDQRNTDEEEREEGEE